MYAAICCFSPSILGATRDCQNGHKQSSSGNSCPLLCSARGCMIASKWRQKGPKDNCNSGRTWTRVAGQAAPRQTGRVLGKTIAKHWLPKWSPNARNTTVSGGCKNLYVSFAQTANFSTAHGREKGRQLAGVRLFFFRLFFQFLFPFKWSQFACRSVALYLYLYLWPLQCSLVLARAERERQIAAQFRRRSSP